MLCRTDVDGLLRAAMLDHLRDENNYRLAEASTAMICTTPVDGRHFPF